MKRYDAGSKVAGGYYWNTRKWDIVALNGDTGVLEGERGEQFIKLPLLAMVVVAVAVSFAYVIFLPFIGFALAGYALAKKVGLLGRTVAREAAATMAPALRPGEAYFAGKGEEKKEDAAPSENLQALEKDIQDRRDGKRPN